MVLKDCLEWGKSLKIIGIFYFEYFISFIIIKKRIYGVVKVYKCCL